MSILPSLIATAERVNKESSHQRALFCWAHDNSELYPELEWMFAVPNGGERQAVVGANLKAEGVKSGVPDILLPARRGPWIGLWIELKRVKTVSKRAGKASIEQNKWIIYFQSIGYGAIVCYGYEDAKKTILDYLNYKE